MDVRDRKTVRDSGDTALIDLFALRQTQITACGLCPRLVAWREQVGHEKRKSFQDWPYWAKPVPDFGDPSARRLIVGLAPAAHGANRTGQMFTGDRSGEWLFRALNKAGAANMPNAKSAADGLRLTGVLITAICHCAPPDNKPTPVEISNCRAYLSELLASRDWAAVLCLGGIAWTHVFRTLGLRAEPFRHGVVQQIADGPRVIGSYHPSQQNTFTGRLTQPMLDSAVQLFLA